MRILFLSYWGLDDPLTISTVFPHLRILQQRSDVESILLVTIERNGGAPAFEPAFEAGKVVYAPLVSEPGRNVLITKTDDFLRFPKQLVTLASEHKSDFIVARGAPAGALAYLVWKQNKLPFYVESFEPHADYMLESGVWKRFDPRYLFQRYWERKQKELARGLMPVAENYRQQLIEEGVPAANIVTVPCSVDLQSFGFDEQLRAQTRARLNIGAEAPVGIYVGKFGDIYYDAEAFDLFRAAANTFGPDFVLIVLTPNPVAEVQAKLAAVGFTEKQVFVTKAPHAEVPGYLSAADFAFATIKPAECRRFCSPIKVGEYWAAGLPILLTAGVGDDSDIIQKEGGGAIFDLTRPDTVPAALQRIAEVLQQPDYRASIRCLAERYRSVERAREAYAQLLPSAG
ncbi:glycosyltransferase [Hymenobacter psychrotolerans]|uniref:Glycosyltransferase involved in cell wall bisynthesis n=1 Tax=Hymenobacter psychrotolerans DSM 18569 TaxID=1121959 RepID=A0A1M7BI11_9BACT|nr:glycosyltransferase [Hymenobacter psychrotolerans]SHL54259.1 Glycosyltransferase involved in cell wall bisynthesis [Hymenobacter psychrotolerans DSM 18569]